MSDEPKIIRLPLDQVKEEYNRLGKERGWTPSPENQILRGFTLKDENTIYLEEGADDIREYHERWHLKHPHGSLSDKDMVDLELKAEISAWKNTGHKDLDIRVGIPAMAVLLSEWPDYYTPKKASSLVLKRLESLGFKYTDSQQKKDSKQFLVDRFGG